MKKTNFTKFFISTVLALVLGVGSSFGQGITCQEYTPNLLTNPGFENGNANWQFFGSAFSVIDPLVTFGPRMGRGNATSEAGFSGVSGVFQDAPASPGEEIHAYGFIALSTCGGLGNDEVFLSLEFYNAGGGQISNTQSQRVNDSYARDVHHKVTVSAVAPAGTAFVRVVGVYVHFSSGTHVSFDDIYLGGVQPYSGPVTANIDLNKCAAMLAFAPPAVSADFCAATITNDFSGTELGCGNFPVGETTVKWTAVDFDGKSSSCEIEVNVVDNVAPSITIGASGPNLLGNPSFENGGANWFVFNIFGAGGNVFQPVNSAPRTGNSNGLMFGLFTRPVDNFSGLVNTDDIAAAPGESYDASIYVQSFGFDFIGNDNIAVLSLDFVDAGGNILSQNRSTPFDRNSPPDTWVKLTAAGTAPAGTALVRMALILEQKMCGTGAIHFDDASLTLKNAQANPAATFDLGAGECAATFNIEYTVVENCALETVSNRIVGTTELLGGGHIAGDNMYEYVAIDASGNVGVSAPYRVIANAFPNPSTTLACNDLVQVSLNNDGCTLISADQLLEGGPYGCYNDYTLTRSPRLFGDCGGGAPLNRVWLNCGDNERLITVTVTDPVSGNSCWSKVRVEDKIGPIFECSVDLLDKAGNLVQSGTTINIDCSIDPETIPAPLANDNCTHIPDVYLKNEVITGEACNVLTLTRTYGSTDEANNDDQGECTITINITQPEIQFPDDITWSCQQYEAFNNVSEATELHPLIIANAADIDAALLCLIPGLGGDDVAGVAPYKSTATSRYWLDGEDLDISLDPRFDDDIDNPITDNSGACNTTTAETDELECFANFSYHIINEGWDVDYLRDCDLNAGGHVPNIIRTPNHRRNAPLMSYPPDHQLRGLEDKDVLAFSGSGVPNVALTPNCTYAVTHSDQKVEACEGLGVDGSTFKIIRTWTVLNWCNGQTTKDVQVIKVLDRKAPVITFQADYNDELISNQPSSNTDHPDCRSNGLIDVPTIEDDCSGVSTIRVYTPVGEATPVTNGGNVVGYQVPSPYLAMGTHTITFEVTDGCGNVTSVDRDITVIDGIPPITVCREFTQISLSAEVDGVTAISADRFDEGSYDYCGPVYFKVRRMERPDCDGFETDRTRFNDDIRFCCSDIGDTVSVILRVYDVEPNDGQVTTSHRAANSNDCMIQVLVEDKSRPHCVAPADVWTNCTDVPDNVDFDDIDQLSTWFGTATGTDNCNVTITESAPDVEVDLCGVGTITRTFTATDDYGNRHLGRCEQVIMIMQQTEYTISVPGDFQEECDDASPQELEYAEIACDLLAMSVEDKDFVASDLGECKKIIRTYKLINWCEYDGASPISVIPRLDLNNDGVPGDGNGGTRTPVNHQASNEWASTGGNLIFTPNPILQIRGGGYYSYDQHIKIFDNTAPDVSYDGDTQICGGDRDEDPCTGAVDILPNASDLCTDVTITWELSAFSDVFSGADFSGSDNLTGRYPLGTHTARFYVEDECGNTSELDITFEIIDCKAPTPVCYNGLSIDVMPLSGMVEIWASDYDASSFDYCHPYELRINRVVDTNGDDVITADDYQTSVPQYDSVQFTCADAGTFVTVQLWVGEISGDNVNNWDYCVSYMDVQDNNGVCSGSKVALGGKIANEDGESVENVMVELNNSMGAMTTDATGEFNFLVPTGGDYSITPMRTDDAANGVTTFDLIKISRHILNVELLDSPYKIIAADANNSGNISTVDLINIRKVILRVAAEFPNNTSWRFVDKTYAFQDALNPLKENFREVANFNNLDASALTANFVAVKVGDVNGDATPNSVLGVDGRTFNGSLNFNATEQSVKAGETFEVAFVADKDVKGFQFTMDLNSTELVEIKNGMTSDKNFNVIGNQVATSFNTDVATAGQTMFTLVLKATGDLTTSNAVAISGAIARAEAYDAAGNMLNVGLDFGTTTTNEFALYQNTPNPFKGETVIGFNLPESAAATLTVSDVQGKVLQIVTGDYTKGYNQVSLNSANLSQGVLYYQLDTDNFTATKKMVVIE